MAEFDCKKCLHEKVCALWASRESQDASCFCTDGCDYFTPTLTPPNEPLTIEQLREMGGQPYWHVGLREESSPPHWNILDPFYAKHIEDYRYGENWLAYRRPPEGEEHCYG
jgi:hypothetical protein